MYTVEFTRQANKALMSIQRDMAQTIMSRIHALAADPHAVNLDIQKLQGRDGWRLRVGDWRVLYQIEGKRLVIVVLAVKPRGGAYK
jgi:mRNA interferase RelE/StbE